jgi:hypothetical protein
MKHVLGFLGVLALFVGLVFVASPAKGQALVSRIVHFVDPVPQVPEEDVPQAPPDTTSALGPGTAVPPWRAREHEGERAYLAGDFTAAAAAWNESSPKAPPADSMRLRKRADRASIYFLLASGSPPVGGSDPVADEKEYRRRLDALKSPTAGSYLELADFAASRGLRTHLAFLYERAYEHQARSPDEVQQKVSRIVRQKRTEKAAPAKDVLEAVMRELPTSEAADIAREETGEGSAPAPSGLGGVVRRGETPAGKSVDPAKVAEAYRLLQVADSEYHLAIPGSRDVNKHRRAALDAYTKARNMFDDIDRASGFEGHQKEIHDCNRSIVELQKDLPIGK